MKKKADLNQIPYKTKLNKDGKLIERNKRGDDFGRTDSDVDVIAPGIDHLIGGPIIAESKYRQSNVLAKTFKDFTKTRPSSFLTPLMILECKGKRYMMRWLGDFQHIDWMRDRTWSDIWITSHKLAKSNTYVEDWMSQSEAYFPDKAKQYGINEEELNPLVITRGYKSQAITIQRIYSSEEFLTDEVA